MGGDKLRSFVVFKGVPGARIETALPGMLPEGIFATCQPKAWMDQRTTALWASTIWKPYVDNLDSSLLILDDYSCHKQSSFVKELSDLGTELELIPGTF